MIRVEEIFKRMVNFKFILGSPNKSIIRLRNSIKKQGLPPLIDFCSYIKAILFNLLNIKFEIKTDKGRNLEQIRKKLVVSDKIRDFNYIFDKLTEVDLMKSIILNGDQCLALEYSQKIRELDLGNAPQRFSKLVNSDEENKTIIVDYFTNLLTEDILSGNDEYIFKRLDDKIKKDIMMHLAENIIDKI